MKLVPFNEDYVNCDQEGRGGGGADCDKTKSNWRYDHRSFDNLGNRNEGRKQKALNYSETPLYRHPLNADTFTGSLLCPGGKKALS